MTEMRQRDRKKRAERIVVYKTKHPQLTLEEIGTHYKLSPARISQILLAESKKREVEINAN
jgi:DNA-directed RNA polymerase sigma subunit (sigma70/sigma32)